MKDVIKVIGVLIALVLIVMLVYWFPYWNIWALNTLFNLSIPSNGKTWLAMFLMALFFGGGKMNFKKS